MGKKRLAKKFMSPPLEDPPSASSSSEDVEEESQEEVVESEADEEHVESEPENDDEEVSGEEEQTKKASTPQAEVKKTRSRSSVSAPAFVAAATPPPRTKSSRKRPAVERNGGVEGTSSKRAKSNKGSPVSSPAARPLFQRVWSEDDEIVILEGIIDFSAEKGEDVLANSAAFHESIKGSLHVDASREQLINKIRKMKKKYETNAAAGKRKNGEHRSVLTLHEQKAYNLSKRIWGEKEAAKIGGGRGGIDARSTRVGRKEPPPKKNGEQNAGPSQMLASHDLLDEKSFMKEGLKLIHTATRSELEQDWRKLKIEEAEQYLRRIELAGKQTKLVLDAYKKM